MRWKAADIGMNRTMSIDASLYMDKDNSKMRLLRRSMEKRYKRLI